MNAMWLCSTLFVVDAMMPIATYIQLANHCEIRPFFMVESETVCNCNPIGL